MTVFATVTQNARDDNVTGIVLWKGDALAIRDPEIGTSAHRARLGFRKLAFFHALGMVLQGRYTRLVNIAQLSDLRFVSLRENLSDAINLRSK